MTVLVDAFTPPVEKPGPHRLTEQGKGAAESDEVWGHALPQRRCATSVPDLVQWVGDMIAGPYLWVLFQLPEDLLPGWVGDLSVERGRQCHRPVMVLSPQPEAVELQSQNLCGQ
jgi:hypothetical protein